MIYFQKIKYSIVTFFVASCHLLNFNLYLLFWSTGPMSSFHLFIHPLLGLDHYSFDGPISMAELLLHYVTARRANLFILIDDNDITFSLRAR